MKVLYIAPYRDFTGWGNHAINNILSLDSVGVDVVPRPVKLNNHQGDLPERLLELEQKYTDGCTHVISQILPNFYEYRAGLKNIGMVSLETSNCRRAGWSTYCNMMDQMIVPCPHNKKALEDSGVKVPIDIVPAAVDVGKFDKEHPFPSDLKESLREKYVFYYVGDWAARKGLDKIVRAFYTEFSKSEPVELLLKINVGSKNPQETIHNWLSNIKRGLKLHDVEQYKPTIVITDRISDEQIYGLHQNLNCYVCASYGEAVHLPMLDALGFGRSVVAPRHSGMGYYLSEDVGYCVDWREDVCVGACDTLSDIYSAEENWYDISVLSLMGRMREAYQDSDVNKEKRISRGRADVAQLSFESVGKIFVEILNG